MRSRELALALALLLFAAGSVRAEAPTPAAVRAAASAVEADPLMPGWDEGKALRFKRKAADEAAAGPAHGDVGWWGELVGNLNTGLRVALWLLGAGLLIAVLLRLREWLTAQRGGAEGLASGLAPTHVGSLDIRPESLPADVGAAALALWQRGEARAALSLLYRAALSRLVHGHGVPIRAASTESECLRLAALRLPPEALAYLRALVACWQTTAYARREPAAGEIEGLCAGFEASLAPGAPR